MEYHDKAINILEKVFDEDVADKIAVVYNNIGNDYQEQGNIDKALEYLTKALDLYKKRYGEDYPIVAKFYNNIGSSYSKQKNYENLPNFRYIST